MLVTKTPLVKASVFMLFAALAFTSCQSVTNDGSQTNVENEDTRLSLKRIIVDMKDDKAGSTFSMELDYPEDWNTKMISSNVFYASENPELVTDGFANNFHATVFKDVDDTDIGRYSNTFLINEQSKFPTMSFQVIQSEKIKGKKGTAFQIDHIKVWGNTTDTVFSISALAKMNRNIVHLNFYSSYEERKATERLAKDIVSSVRIVE